MRSTRFRLLILLILLSVAAAWKAWILLADAVPFNGDEAIVGLMARHILLNGERPAFFYGQAYMGSLDAYLVAAGFAIFGVQVWVIRLVQVLLYLAVLATSVVVGKRFFGSWLAGFIGTLLLAIPPVNVTLYTTASLGGYGEALLIGNLVLLSGLSWLGQIEGNPTSTTICKAFIFGGCIGLGLWANGLTLIYSIPMAVAVLVVMIQKRVKLIAVFRGVSLALVGFAIGSLPWWLYAFDQGFSALMRELLGNNVAVESGTWLARIGQHLLNLVVLGGSVTFGFRPPWEVRWLVLPLLPIVLVFWLGILFFFIRQFNDSAQKMGRWLLVGILGTFCAGFMFTSFGVDPSGRYFLAVYWLFAMAAGAVLAAEKLPLVWKSVLLALVIVFQAWGTIDCVTRNPPGLTTQFYAPTVYDHRSYPELIEFLKEQGETRGYSTYWVSYPLAFRSQEELIFSPKLPYHTDLGYSGRDDRYVPYTEQVESSEKVAFITARNLDLNAYLRTKFLQMGIQWKEHTIGDFQVFYGLSKAVRPIELGIGNPQP